MRLPLLLLLSLSLLLFAGQSARAQFLTADDFFHGGAQFYISNNIPLAKERVKMGRQLYPDDDKLKKLEQLLDQQQQSQSQSQQNQQDQKQDQSQQGQKSQQKDQQQQQQQQQADQSQAEKDKEKAEQAKKDSDQKKEQEKQQQAEEQKAAEDKSGGDTNEVADARGAHPMTPKEAEQLLNAQKGGEQYLALKPKKTETPSRQIKDW